MTLIKLYKDTQLVYYTAEIPTSSIFVQHSSILPCIKIKIEGRKVSRGIFIMYVKVKKMHWTILNKERFYSRLLQQGKEARTISKLNSTETNKQQGFRSWIRRRSQAICVCYLALPKVKVNFLISSGQEVVLLLGARHPQGKAGFLPFHRHREVEALPSVMMTFQTDHSQILQKDTPRL